MAIVLLDSAKIHTPQGAKVVREAVERHGDRLRLVPTPAHDPQANPAELLFRPFRRAVTHNHHRDDVVDLFRDGAPFGSRYLEDLDRHPERALRHIRSLFAAACLCADTEERRLMAALSLTANGLRVTTDLALASARRIAEAD
jgi:hypothetical protein